MKAILKLQINSNQICTLTKPLNSLINFSFFDFKMAQRHSFKKLISISKDLDELLNRSNSITSGARTYLRSKTNTFNFFKYLGEQVPAFYGYLEPNKRIPELPEGNFICKPEVGWGSIGVFDLRVSNKHVYSKKLNKEASTVHDFFNNHDIDERYRIEEHLVDESTESVDLGVTDFKFHCFQGLDFPIACIKNRTIHYAIWVDKKMNIIHVGKHNNLPKHLYSGFLESTFIKLCGGINFLVNRSSYAGRGIDVYRYLNKFIDESRQYPLEELREFNKESFFKLGNHANQLMSKIPLTYCRIDLYNTNKGIVAGELTPIPGGIYRFYPEIDSILGEHYSRAQKNLIERCNEGHFDSVLDFLNHRMLIE